MEKLTNTFETCEDCYKRVCIMDMVVKDTPDGICIYCQKCAERHKLLDKGAGTLCRKWGMMLRNLKRN